MKAVQRLLQRLALLVLVVIVWPGGSDVGIGMDDGKVSQKTLPPGSP